MRANESVFHELEEREGVRDGAKVMEIEGKAHPDPSEGEGERGAWRQSQGTPKRQKEDGQGESTARGRGRWMWNGQKDAWCSQWCEKGGRREGLCAGLQTGKPALWRQTDGDPVLKNRRKSPPRKLDQLQQAQWAQQCRPPAALNWHRQWPKHRQPKSRELHNFQGRCTGLHQLKPGWAQT